MRAYFCVLEVAVSANRCSVIQGCRICNKMEEDGNSSYPPTPLNASIYYWCCYIIIEYDKVKTSTLPLFSPTLPPFLCSGIVAKHNLFTAQLYRQYPLKDFSPSRDKWSSSLARSLPQYPKVCFSVSWLRAVDGKLWSAAAAVYCRMSSEVSLEQRLQRERSWKVWQDMCAWIQTKEIQMLR